VEIVITIWSKARNARKFVTVIHNLIALAQRLELHKLIVIASLRQKLVVCARLAHFALLDEVAVSQKMKCQQGMFKNPGNGKNTTDIRSAFWMVDNRCAMAIVVLPFAAWSKAACTTFSEFESSADVAWCKNPA
jgi:hypothetical protein